MLILEENWHRHQERTTKQIKKKIESKEKNANENMIQP